MSSGPTPAPIPRMTCPGCGAHMNPHAEKLVAPRTASEAAAVAPGLEGLIEEVHHCAACGRVESRLSPAVNRPGN